MNIEHLYEFIELSRRLNFTAAAKALHMTQPALSNHVRALERETGVMLIERSAKDQARLTPAGQLFLDMATQMVALHADVMPRLRDMQKSIEGKIIVRSPRNEYSYPLLDYIYEFRREYPQVDIVIWPWDDVDGIEDVASGTVDCAYVGYADSGASLAPEERAVELVPYASTEIYLWVDRSHPLAMSEQLVAGDLNGYSILIPANKKHDSWYAGISTVIRQYGLECRINEKYCDSLEDLVLTKAQADDVLLCDENLLGSSAFRLRDDRVARHFDPAMMVPVSLGYANRAGNAALDAFIEFLQGKYQQLPAAE